MAIGFECVHPASVNFEPLNYKLWIFLILYEASTNFNTVPDLQPFCVVLIVVLIWIYEFAYFWPRNQIYDLPNQVNDGGGSCQ